MINEKQAPGPERATPYKAVLCRYLLVVVVVMVKLLLPTENRAGSYITRLHTNSKTTVVPWFPAGVSCLGLQGDMVLSRDSRSLIRSGPKNGNLRKGTLVGTASSLGVGGTEDTRPDRCPWLSFGLHSANNVPSVRSAYQHHPLQAPSILASCIRVFRSIMYSVMRHACQQEAQVEPQIVRPDRTPPAPLIQKGEKDQRRVAGGGEKEGKESASEGALTWTRCP
ncbi:hypothetical protein BO71DRAFT_204707 [Aspergillus ellipticus CBS 707.79]|uniref:Uncharacterized protein n=1 Tax=Aspergillus ellipticus CBS 707.79 TaxID=1448320 RepID=A0A319DDH7_9EURO|nr:hypothetical protein BO71DRAFT_204707 [Aspergillus ellipticus CBS 707.79]